MSAGTSVPLVASYKRWWRMDRRAGTDWNYGRSVNSTTIPSTQGIPTIAKKIQSNICGMLWSSASRRSWLRFPGTEVASLLLLPGPAPADVTVAGKDQPAAAARRLFIPR